MPPLVSQDIAAVQALLAFVGRASDPLPVDVSLDNGRLVLVLNGARNAYYTTTAAACSCPAAHWKKGPCKHVKRYFPEAPKASGPLVERGGFKPFSLLPSEEKGAA